MYFDGSVHIEEEDQCYSCEYFLKGVSCPLLEALGVGVAHLDGDVLVRNCGFYKEFKRHLKLIDLAASEEPPHPETGGPVRKSL
jgi:hypothetical protein